MKIRPVCLAVLVGMCACGSSPEKAVNGFLTAKKNADYEAFQEYCPSVYNSIGNMLPSEVEQLIPENQGLQWSIIETEFTLSGDRAGVSVAMQEPGIETIILIYHCKQENNRWIVYGLEDPSLGVIVEGLDMMLPGFGLPPSPEEVVRNAFDAIQTGDGEVLVECMSAEQVAELNTAVEEMKVNPEESAEMMAFIGIEITAEEISNIDAAGFVTLLFQSEMFDDEFADMEVTVGDERIEGEEAWVEVTVDGETQEVKLVKEHGNWVISEGFDMM